MNILKSDNDLHLHKENAFTQIEKYIDKLIASRNQSLRGKADRLCYWLEDYMKFLSFESQFSPSSLRRYKRGEIIKTHLGYNIGSEEGGLHYCVVLDKSNSIYSPVLTIIPLTSVKSKTDINNLHKGEVFLRNELFTNLNSKVSLHTKSITVDLENLQETINSLKQSSPVNASQIKELTSKLNAVEASNNSLKRMRSEVSFWMYYRIFGYSYMKSRKPL